MPRLFLSYSNKDRQKVHELAIALREVGIDVWLDRWEIKVGDQISQKIDAGLQDAEFLAIWLTNRSIASGWVQREWQAKFNEEISTGKTAVLPLLGEPCEIPALLRDKKYADFTRNFEEGLSELLVALGAQPSPNQERKCQRCRSSMESYSHYDSWEGDSDGLYPRYVSRVECPNCGFWGNEHQVSGAEYFK